MPETDGSPGAVYRAECSCGWEIARRKDKANLPAENNRRITRSTAAAHQFTHEWRNESYEVSGVSEVSDV